MQGVVHIDGFLLFAGSELAPGCSPGTMKRVYPNQVRLQARRTIPNTELPELNGTSAVIHSTSRASNGFPMATCFHCRECSEVVPADDGAARKLFNGDDLGLTFYTQLGIAWPNLGFFL